MLLGSLMQQLFPERGKVSSEALREGATSISPRAVTERDRRTAEKRNGRGGGTKRRGRGRERGLRKGTREGDRGNKEREE